MKYEQIHVNSVPKGLKEDIRNAAKHKGVSVSQMIKQVMREHVDKLPERYKRKIED